MSMDSLKFKVDQILEKLKANREEHVLIVREAQKGYRVEAEKVLAKKLHDLREGKSVDPGTNLTTLLISISFVWFTKH